MILSIYFEKLWNFEPRFLCVSLSAYLHACRALAVCAVITGFFGGVLTLIGMKCTKIGGSEIANARVTFAGGITYLVSGKAFIVCVTFVWMSCTQHVHSEAYALLGFCGMITYTWWASRVISEFLDPNFRAQKWVLLKQWYYFFYKFHVSADKQSVLCWCTSMLAAQIWAWSCSVHWLGRLHPSPLRWDGADVLLWKRRPTIKVNRKPSTLHLTLISRFLYCGAYRQMNHFPTMSAVLQKDHAGLPLMPAPGPDGLTCCRARRPESLWDRRCFMKAGKAEQRERQRGPVVPSAGTLLSETNSEPRKWL